MTLITALRNRYSKVVFKRLSLVPKCGTWDKNSMLHFMNITVFTVYIKKLYSFHTVWELDLNATISRAKALAAPSCSLLDLGMFTLQ